MIRQKGTSKEIILILLLLFAFFAPLPATEEAVSEKEADVIILKDGSYISGRVLDIPKAIFGFGETNFDVGGIAEVVFEGDKMDVTSREGCRYKGRAGSGMIIFNRYEPSIKEPTATFRQILNSGDVSRIITAAGRGSVGEETFPYFSIEFKNGDVLPVRILDKSLRLSDGWREYNLATEKIANLSFDSVLSGFILDDRGKERELERSFIRDKFLHLRMVNPEKNIGVSWEEVAAIRRKGGVLSTNAGEIFDDGFSVGDLVKAYLVDLMGYYETEELCARYCLKNLKEDLLERERDLSLLKSRVTLLSDSLLRRNEKLGGIKEKYRVLKEKKNALSRELAGQKSECANRKEYADQLEQYMASLKKCFGEEEERNKAAVEGLREESSSLRERLVRAEKLLEEAEKTLEKRQQCFMEDIFLASSALGQLKSALYNREREMAEVSERATFLERENAALKEKLKESAEVIEFLKTVLPESN